jgi:hypothetical protein
MSDEDDEEEGDNEHPLISGRCSGEHRNRCSGEHRNLARE